MTVKKPRAPRPFYPDLPNSDNPFFWLAAFLRDLAEWDELKTLRDKSYGRRRCSHVLQCALGSAATAKMQEASQSLRYATADGLLLCAFPGTTVLDGGAA